MSEFCFNPDLNFTRIFYMALHRTLRSKFNFCRILWVIENQLTRLIQRNVPVITFLNWARSMKQATIGLDFQVGFAGLVKMSLFWQTSREITKKLIKINGFIVKKLQKRARGSSPKGLGEMYVLLLTMWCQSCTKWNGTGRGLKFQMW